MRAVQPACNKAGHNNGASGGTIARTKWEPNESNGTELHWYSMVKPQWRRITNITEQRRQPTTAAAACQPAYAVAGTARETRGFFAAALPGTAARQRYAERTHTSRITRQRSVETNAEENQPSAINPANIRYAALLRAL